MNWKFYSLACCAGGGGKHSSLPYLAYDLKDDRSRKIALYIAQKLIESGMDCEIEFDDDSFMHENFPDDYPTINLTRFRIQTLVEDREKKYKKMFDVLTQLENVDLDKFEINLNFKDVVDYGPMFVNPKYVGNGLQYQMLQAIDNYCINLGYKYAAGTIHPDNIYSIRNLLKDNFLCFVLRVYLKGLS